VCSILFTLFNFVSSRRYQGDRRNRAAQVHRGSFSIPCEPPHTTARFPFRFKSIRLWLVFVKYKREKVASFADKINPINPCHRRPFNIKHWIAENRDLLKPPVGNKSLYTERAIILLWQWGPNARKDYHFNVTENCTINWKAMSKVKIQEDGKAVEIPIKEGELFYCPEAYPLPDPTANTWDW